MSRLLSSCGTGLLYELFAVLSESALNLVFICISLLCSMARQRIHFALLVHCRVGGCYCMFRSNSEALKLVI